MAIERAESVWARVLACLMAGGHKCLSIATHPRTHASVEMVYASHGLIDSHTTAGIVIYALLLLVSLAHMAVAHSSN